MAKLADSLTVGIPRDRLSTADACAVNQSDVFFRTGKYSTSDCYIRQISQSCIHATCSIELRTRFAQYTARNLACAQILDT